MSQKLPRDVVHNAYSPKEAMEICGRTGASKGHMRADKIFLSSFLGGCLLSFPGACLLSTETSPWFQENAPGLIKFVGGMLFPFGLVMIVVTGTDLCTGSFFYTTVAALQRRLSILKMLNHWAITFFGNLAGSLFVMAIITGYGNIFAADPYVKEIYKFGNGKMVTPEWHQIFLRAIGANWLVCVGCYIGAIGRELSSKVLGIWFPVFAFVCLGLDHVVANMYLITTSIFLGNPDITVGYYIWKSMIPALIGNIVGGGLFVGVLFWYLHLFGEEPIPIDGVYYGDDAALVGTNTPVSTNSGGSKKHSEHMA